MTVPPLTYRFTEVRFPRYLAHLLYVNLLGRRSTTKIKKATSPAAIIPRYAHGVVAFRPSRRRSCIEVRFRHLGQVLPLPSNLEPIFFMTWVGSTFGLFSAIRRLSSVLVSRTNSRSYGVGHFSDLIHTRRPTFS